MLEVGRVIAIALQLETGSGKLLAERFFAAFRAGGERHIAHFLHDILLHTTTAATIFVNRHDFLLSVRSRFRRRLLYPSEGYRAARVATRQECPTIDEGK